MSIQSATHPTLLYPRVPNSQAKERVEELQSLPLDKLFELSELEPSGIVFAPTGGVRIDVCELGQLRDGIRECAQLLGYPSPNASRSKFDMVMTRWIHSNMRIRVTEASQFGVWSYIGLYLVPELARWRFPGEKDKPTGAKRFLGSSRGLRNVLGRLWWRGEYLRQEPGTFIFPELPSALDDLSRLWLTNEPYGLVSLLGEDELVGITERPTLSGNRAFCRSVARALVVSHAKAPRVTRSQLLRDAMKRIYRLGGIMTFEALDELTLYNVLCGVFDESISAMRKSDAGQVPEGT